MKDTGAPVKTKKQNIIASLIPYLLTKRILIGSAAVVLLLAAAVAISFLTNDNNEFLPYEQNVEVIAYNDCLNVLVDDKLLSRLDNARECQQLRSGIDGSIAAFLTENKELYVVDGQRLKKIADDVHHFEISASGEGIAYAQKYVDQYALTLYCVPERMSREVTDALSRLDFSLSPDGQTVAYYEQSEDAEVLMYHRDGKSHTVTEEQTDLVGLCDNGKYIYAVCSKARDRSVLCAFNSRGKKQELGAISSISIKFNDDHRQIMFYNNGETYVSVNAQEGVLASSYPLYMVTAPNSQGASDGNSITYPVTSLFDHVYTCSDGESTSAWLIKKNAEKSIKLVSRVSGCTLDASAKYLYYLHDMEQLRFIRIRDGEDAAESYRSIADNVDAYAVTSDRRRVYFTSDGDLCSTNAKRGGSVKTICQDTANINLVLNTSNVIYYLQDGQLYACKNGRKGSQVAENIQSVYSSSNAVVYILGNEGLYTSTDKKQPTLVAE